MALALLAPSAGASQSLRGSLASVERQRKAARAHDFTLLRTANDVQRFAALGLLVPVRGNEHYYLTGVSFPYARPQVLTFIERLASQYYAACGERLVVTSLTRPVSHQPLNASSESVHPAGMAVDLRISTRAACRTWLERTLLSLEARGLAEATKERKPPHYHVALFPSPYERFVEKVSGARTQVAADGSN